MAVLVYVIDFDAIETRSFKWIDQFGPLGPFVDEWFDREVAAWAGRTVRIRLVELTVALDPSDTHAIEAEIGGSWELIRIATAKRSYEHPAWFNAVRAFNIAQAGKGSAVD